MKKTIAIGTVAIFLAACGDDVTEVTNINQMGMDVVASAKDLPKCTENNEGSLVLVKGESSIRVCVGGEWKSTSQSVKDTVYMGSDVSCKTEELGDKSGLKIVCNGDSIGVVLNGSDGKDGSDGEDGKDAVLPNDTLEADSERVPISLDSLAGFTQKGPFLKGSTVYLYELSDGRTLKQTNGNFTSIISRDDGRYKFTARDLVSQYAMVVVDGYYRNEVTGESSGEPIRMRALTDMRKHRDVNVNLFTHLEFDRVYYLVTRGDSTGKKLSVKQAKRQAQREILKLFYIELDENTDAEDLNVFGTSDADAALLAVSILLQGNRSVPELAALLTAIANDLETDGKWNEKDADSIKVTLAIWALNNHGRLGEFSDNVKGWGLGEVPEFEKYIDSFIAKVLGIDNCDAAREGKKLTVSNKYSPFNGQTFVCKDGNYVAIRTEKTQFNPDIHYGEMIDMRDHKVYKTVDIGTQTWMAENLDFADTLAYPALKTGMMCAENKRENCEKYGRFYDFSTAFDSTGIYGGREKMCATSTTGNTLCSSVYPVRGICPEGWHIPSADEMRLFWVNVGSTKAVLSKEYEIGTDSYGFSAIYTGYFGGSTFSFDSGAVYFWVTPIYYERPIAARLHNSDSVNLSHDYLGGDLHNTASSYYMYPIRCLKDKELVYGSFVDGRDNQQYKTLEIGGKTWMAQNLNYKPENLPDSSSFCLNEDPTNCDKYGRYYYTEESVHGVCPQGWHLPDASEWNDVFNAHGRSAQAMQSLALFATNTLGLGLLPMSPYNYQKGTLDLLGSSSVWADGGYCEFTSTPASNLPDTHIYCGAYPCKGCPVRCVKDDDSE